MTGLLKEFISENHLPGTGHPILLGVSGGIDSMVLLDLLSKAGYNISVAHCNFSLRGKESDLDERFVEEVCAGKGIGFHTVRFDTAAYAKTKRISIQMAARDLRYEWFEIKRVELGLGYIALAHNKNDVVETFMINLSRGTGLNGLTGIKPVNGNLIRPLLFATREMIRAYAAENNITYREDSSNNETKYLRNRVRHLILPHFEILNSSAVVSINETIRKLSEAYDIVTSAVESRRSAIFTVKDDVIEANKETLRGLDPLKTYLFELFREFGISPGQVDDLAELLDAESGRMIETAKYRIFSDRDKIHIVLSEQDNEGDDDIVFKNESELLSYSGHFHVSIIKPVQFIPADNPSRAWLDARSLSYPVIVRKWRAGDYLYPYGLKGKKKLSDLFIDLKIPLYMKEKVMIMQSGNDIAWVIGIRADRRFCVTGESKMILEFYAGE